MQQANCHVRLAGDVGNEVFKSCITPAELLILQAIHGGGSVLKIEPRGMDKRSHADEIERLKTEYGDDNFKKVFPGFAPQLPVSFRDVGVDVHSDDEGPVTAKTKAKKSAAESQPEAGAEA